MHLIVETMAERCKWLHDVLRDEVRDLTQEQLDYVPAPGTNSIGVLVMHTLSSEAQLIGIVAGEKSHRDRAAEFTTRGVPARDLISHLNMADETIEELLRSIKPEDLNKSSTIHEGSAARTGTGWLMASLGHSREHLAHIQLMKQLCPDRFPPPARPW